MLRSVDEIVAADRGVRRTVDAVARLLGTHYALTVFDVQAYGAAASAAVAAAAAQVVNDGRPRRLADEPVDVVPIVYAGRPVGALALRNGDTDLAAALADRLAIVLQRARLDRVGRTTDLPVVALAVTAVAVVAWLLLVMYDHHDVDEAFRSSEAARAARAGIVSSNVQRSFGAMEQLARSSAATARTGFGSVRAIERFVRAQLAATDPRQVYGIGVWYEPFAFQKIRYVGIYAHRAPQVGVVVTHEWERPSYDFPHRDWYLTGRGVTSAPRTTPSYVDADGTYVSTVARFDGSGGGGVISVDTRTDLLADVAASATRDEITYVTDERGAVVAYPLQLAERMSDETQALDLARRTIGPSLVGELAIEQPPWHVHTVTSRRSLDATIAAIHTRTTLADAFVALVLALVWWSAVRRRRAENAVRRSSLELAERDIELNERRRNEARLQYAASHDALTGIANRTAFFAAVAAAIEDLRYARGAYAVLFIDLDRFSVVNDTFGHAAGDAVLCAVASRLRSLITSDDVAGRIGGDEFAVLIRRPAVVEATAAISDRVIGELSRPYPFDGRELDIEVSIGIAIGDERYNAPSEVLRDADIAMYHAKGSSDRRQTFERDLHGELVERFDLETQLRRAIERREIIAHFQPVRNLSGRIVSYEALARWQHPQRGLLMPSTFISVAEWSRRVIDVDRCVLDAALDAVVALRDVDPEIRVAVNISAAHLLEPDLPDTLIAALRRRGLPVAALELELTESALMANAGAASRALAHLREVGFEVWIDDFGTGYSSLAYLSRFAVQGLKIDRSFIVEIGRTRGPLEIVRTIVALARTLRIEVIAEGVEWPGQMEIVRTVGVDRVQGYLFGKPRPIDQILSDPRSLAELQREAN